MTPTSAMQATNAATYEAIERAFSETPRGRWFLAEHARRSRTAELRALSDVLAKLGSNLEGKRHEESRDDAPSREDCERLSLRLAQMHQLIADAKTEMAHGRPEPSAERPRADEPFAWLVRAQEEAAARVLDAAQMVQELAWSLRDQGVDAGFCDNLEERGKMLKDASKAADAASDRMRRLVRMVAQLEARVEMACKASRALTRDGAGMDGSPGAFPARLVVDNGRAEGDGSGKERESPRSRASREVFVLLDALRSNEKLRRFTGAAKLPPAP